MTMFNGNTLEYYATKYFFFCLWRTSFHKLSEASPLAASSDVAKQEIQTRKVAYQKKKKKDLKPNKKGIVLQGELHFIWKATKVNVLPF